jgi:phosphotransferase system IIA component
VKVGDPLVDFSIDLVEEKANSIITPIVITNSTQIEHIEWAQSKAAKKAETGLLKVDVKNK